MRDFRKKIGKWIALNFGEKAKCFWSKQKKIDPTAEYNNSMQMIIGQATYQFAKRNR